MDQLRVGLVGCGKVAAFHTYALERLAERAVLRAVFDIDCSRARQFAAMHGAIAFEDLDAMANSGLDAAIVCTPPMAHHSGALPFLRRGISAFVEKPFASTLAQADAMLQASRMTGAALGVCCQRRWLPPMQRIYRAIEEGKLGKLILCNATINGYRNAAYYEMDGGWRGRLATEGGALLVNQAPHHTDLMVSLMGAIRSVSATVANLTHPEIDGDDNVLATVRFRSGAIGSVRYSNSQKPGFFAGIEITDENGITVAVKTDGVMFVAGAAGSAGVASMIEPPSITHWSGASALAAWNAEDAAIFNAFEDPTKQFHVFALADFLEAIYTGRPPRIDGEAGRRTVEFNTACYLSSAAGMTPVKLPLAAQPESPTFEGRTRICRLEPAYSPMIPEQPRSGAATTES